MVAAVDKAIKQLDKGMLKLVKEHYSETFDLVTSVPGVGLKTATMMICITDGFKKFSHAQVKQFISYIGMSPRTFESGTSVKGRAHISKEGNSVQWLLLSLFQGFLSLINAHIVLRIVYFFFWLSSYTCTTLIASCYFLPC
jgi:transposase